MGKRRIPKKTNEIRSTEGLKKPEIPSSPGVLGSSRIEENEWPNLNTDDLLAIFDHHLSSESTLSDEGVRVVRDMYLELMVLEKKLHKRFMIFSQAKGKVENEKRLLTTTLNGEKDELAKYTQQKEKLQNLSEELARQKNELIESSKKTGEAEKVRRQNMNDEFMNKIKDISTRLDECTERRTRSIEENENLKSQVRSQLDVYQNLEKEHNEMILKLDEQISHSAKIFDEQEEILNSEKAKVQGAQERIAIMTEIEKALRSELSSYLDQLNVFQTSVLKNNETFAHYKAKVDEMNAKIRKAEKEGNDLNELSSREFSTLQDIVYDKANVIAAAEKEKKKIGKLQSLIAVLEGEICDMKISSGCGTSPGDVLSITPQENSENSPEIIPTDTELDDGAKGIEVGELATSDPQGEYVVTDMMTGDGSA